jgi:peptide/nickel transport system permease protein
MLTRNRLRLIRRRLLQIAPVIVLATFVVFGLQQLVPGDIAVTLAGDNATDARIAEIRTLYGLDRPFFVQYGSWLWDALHGNLGKSILSGEAVLDSIQRRFPTSLLIVGCALSLSLVIGIPLGILAATHRGSRIDAFVTSIASLGVALPNFWLAMLLVATFALNWNFFPATGAAPLSAGVGKALHYAALPAFALAAGGIAEVARQLRSSRQGAVAHGHPVEAWAEECQRQPADGDRAGVQSPARRHGGDRGGVRHTWHRQHGRPCRHS